MGSDIKLLHSRYKHGAYLRNPKLYSVWITMIHRCENPKRAKYHDYGGRGIKVCKEWHDPNNFIDWSLNNGYKEGLQLDREDNDGNYEPANCRWTTPKVNSRNRRNTVYLTVNDSTKCVAEWCEIVDISPYTIYWWIKKRGKEYAEQRIRQEINKVA